MMLLLSNTNTNFNPPSPCGEGLDAMSVIRQANQFQSTLPVRGGTDIYRYYE